MLVLCATCHCSPKFIAVILVVKMNMMTYLWKRMLDFFFDWSASASSISKASTLSNAFPPPGTSLITGNMLLNSSFTLTSPHVEEETEIRVSNKGTNTPYGVQGCSSLYLV